LQLHCVKALALHVYLIVVAHLMVLISGVVVATTTYPALATSTTTLHVHPVQSGMIKFDVVIIRLHQHALSVPQRRQQLLVFQSLFYELPTPWAELQAAETLNAALA
jgi:hypothetical protein